MSGVCRARRRRYDGPREFLSTPLLSGRVHHTGRLELGRIHIHLQRPWAPPMDERLTLSILGWGFGAVVAMLFVLNAVALGG